MHVVGTMNMLLLTAGLVVVAIVALVMLGFLFASEIKSAVTP